MKKPSEEARRRYTDYIKDYKSAIDGALEKEKKTTELIAADGPGVGYQRLALADGNLNLVASYLLMNSLSLAFLGVKNEAYLNEARKCLYKTIIALEANKYTPSLALAFRIARVFGCQPAVAAGRTWSAQPSAVRPRSQRRPPRRIRTAFP
jgi:hypothetical protein